VARPTVGKLNFIVSIDQQDGIGRGLDQVAVALFAFLQLGGAFQDPGFQIAARLFQRVLVALQIQKQHGHRALQAGLNRRHVNQIERNDFQQVPEHVQNAVDIMIESEAQFRGDGDQDRDFKVNQNAQIQMGASMVQQHAGQQQQTADDVLADDFKRSEPDAFAITSGENRKHENQAHQHGNQNQDGDHKPPGIGFAIQVIDGQNQSQAF
jgi:hypothetical protein